MSEYPPNAADRQDSGAAYYRSTNANGYHSNGYGDFNAQDYAATITGELSEDHRKALKEESAISDAAIEARGYYSVESGDEGTAHLRSLGFSKGQAQNVPGMVIPLYDHRGARVGNLYKPDIAEPDSDSPTKKPRKYENPPGQSPIIDCAPLTQPHIDDPTKPIVFTEGSKKADSAASRGVVTASLGGVYGFLGRNSKGGTTVATDLEYIPVKGRVVIAAFDSDVTVKPSVQGALRRFCNIMQRRGAVVKIVILPDGPNGAKTGLDDFFARGGTVEELFVLARDIEPVQAKKARQFSTPLDLPDSHAVEFPQLSAEKIATPKLTGDFGAPEYDARQIVELLRPDWEVAALTTHAAHAARIRTHMGADAIYCAQLGWLYWNGRHWEIDDRNTTATGARVAGLSRVVRAESAALYRHAATLATAGRSADATALSQSATDQLRHAKQVEGKSFIDGALHLAAGTLRTGPDAFDQRPWCIGFQNGTWDHNQWREHRRDDYLLHLSPVTIDLGSDLSEWLAVLNRITAGDREFALTLQDIAGYVLSGASHLRYLPWPYGPKGTGKSTYTELLQTVLGSMAATIDPKKLQDDAARERLGADLWNKRAAICSEAGSKRLESELLKTLSGSDSLPVRFLYREAFTAPPRHTLIMVSNDPPRVDAYDDALRDRVTALPFIHPLSEPAPLTLTGGRRIEAVRRDPDSPLVRGFAVWAIEGLSRVFETQSIHRARCVEAATVRFWSDTDPVTPFWETVEEEELREGIAKSALRKRYEEWCDREGARPLAARQWTRACASHGLADERRGGGVHHWYLAEVTKVTKRGHFSESPKNCLRENIEKVENNPCFVTNVTDDDTAVIQ